MIRIPLIALQRALAWIFHNDCDEEAAKVGWGEVDEFFDAGLSV